MSQTPGPVWVKISTRVWLPEKVALSQFTFFQE